MNDTAPANPTASRFGDWILTASGRKFYPFDPIVEDVELSDIAHALSQLNRWTGHTSRPISVAQHAIMVSNLVERLAPDLALAALHHDDAEAYLGDIAAPIKRVLRVDVGGSGTDQGGDALTLADCESALRRVIYTALQIPWPDAAGWTVIDQADRRALLLEARDLMMPMPADAVLHTYGRPPPEPSICTQMAYEARDNYLHLHKRLSGT